MTATEIKAVAEEVARRILQGKTQILSRDTIRARTPGALNVYLSELIGIPRRDALDPEIMLALLGTTERRVAEIQEIYGMARRGELA